MTPTPHDELVAEIEADLAALGLTPTDLARAFGVLDNATDDAQPE